MKILQIVHQIASPVADRNLFRSLFVGDNTVHLDTVAFLQASRGEEFAMELFDGIVPARNTCGVWTSFACTVAAFFFFLLPHSFLFAAVATEQGPRSPVIRTGQFPGVRFSFHLTVCDQALPIVAWLHR